MKPEDWDRASQLLENSMMLAEADAAARKHGFVATIHAMAAILRLPASAGVLALVRAGYDIPQLTAELEKWIPPGPLDTLRTLDGTYRLLPQTPRFKLAVDLAFAIASELKHERVTTGHLLLGILRPPPEVIAEPIRKLDLNAEKIQAALEDVSEL